jgi:hypothetical protein
LSVLDQSLLKNDLSLPDLPGRCSKAVSTLELIAFLLRKQPKFGRLKAGRAERKQQIVDDSPAAVLWDIQANRGRVLRKWPHEHSQKLFTERQLKRRPPPAISKLFADGIEMSKLLEHAEVVAHCKVLDNLRLFQAETLDMLDGEFPAIGSQGWPMQRGGGFGGSRRGACLTE